MLLSARLTLVTASLCTRRSVAAMADGARDRMMGEIASAGSAACENGDASGKKVLTRGCDPVMAERAGKMLPPMLGNVQMVGVTDDDTFFRLLETEQFDVVLFAPGACRYNAARQPIPGGNEQSEGGRWRSTAGSCARSRAST